MPGILTQFRGSTQEADYLGIVAASVLARPKENQRTVPSPAQTHRSQAGDGDGSPHHALARADPPLSNASSHYNVTCPEVNPQELRSKRFV